MSTGTLFKLIKLFSVIGVVLAVYLLYQQITLSSFRPCSINATINCDAVISGPVAKTFGVPTPLYGLIGYICIFWAAVFKKKKTLIAIATFGLIFCLSIAYIELVQLKVICPICILCQLLMISVFTMSIVIKRRNEEGSN